MKTHPLKVFLLPAIFLFAFCSACKMQSDESKSISVVRIPGPVEGVWELANRYWVLDDDTIYADEIGVSHKIYFDGYVMWTADPGPDSSEWHGFGTYQLRNDTLIETYSSMSLAMKDANGINSEFLNIVEYDQDFYKQVQEQEFRETIYLYTEEWKKLNSR